MLFVACFLQRIFLLLQSSTTEFSSMGLTATWWRIVIVRSVCSMGMTVNVWFRRTLRYDLNTGVSSNLVCAVAISFLDDFESAPCLTPSFSL